MLDVAVSTREPLPVPTEKQVYFRAGGFLEEGARRPLASILGAVALIGFWQLASSAGWVRQSFLPSPISVSRELIDLAWTGQLWLDLGASLMRFGIGWSSGCLLGVVVGIAMGLFSAARAIGEPLVSALFPVPKIALLPLIILWLGIGELSKDVTIAASVFFPMVIATYTSIDAVPRNLIRMGQSFGMPTRAIILKIVLPGAVPGLVAGLRISASVGLLTVIVAEMVGAQHGIGAFTLLAGSLLRSDQVIAGVVVIALIGLVLGTAITAMERRLLRWR